MNINKSLQNVSIDADNWKTLGKLQPGEKFEVHTSAGGLIAYGKSILAAARDMVFGVKEISPQKIKRGIAHISGDDRLITQVFHRSIADFGGCVKWLDRLIDTTNKDLKKLLSQVTEANSAKEVITIHSTMDNLGHQIQSAKSLIVNLRETYKSNSEEDKKMLDSLEEHLNHLIGEVIHTREEILPVIINRLIQLIHSHKIDDLTAQVRNVQNDEEKMMLFREVNNFSNDFLAAQQFVKDMEKLHKNSPLSAIINDLSLQLKKMGLLRAECLSSVPTDSFNKPVLVDDAFELVSLFDPIAVQTFVDRSKPVSEFKKRIQLEPVAVGEPELVVERGFTRKPLVILENEENKKAFFEVPEQLMLDIKRSTYKVNGEYFVLTDDKEPRKDYYGCYEALANALTPEGAKRVGVMLNQTITGESAFLYLELGLSIEQDNALYDVTVKDGIVTMRSNLTLTNVPFDKAGTPDAQINPGFYIIEAKFPLEELLADDFYSNADGPLPSLQLTEVVDVSRFSPEQLNVLGSLR